VVIETPGRRLGNTFINTDKYRHGGGLHGAPAVRRRKAALGLGGPKPGPGGGFGGVPSGLTDEPRSGGASVPRLLRP